MQRDILWIGNSNLIRVRKLQNVQSGAYLNAATVTATIKDAAGNPLAGETWPISLSYETGTDGAYSADVSDGLVAANGDTATLVVDCVESLIKAHYEIPLLCLTRKSDAV
jgi:hypothetical protein